MAGQWAGMAVWSRPGSGKVWSSNEGCESDFQGMGMGWGWDGDGDGDGMGMGWGEGRDRDED